MSRYFDETLVVTVAAPGGSGDAVMRAHGEVVYVEIRHLDVGDPAYTLQFVNKRGTVMWESSVLTGDCIVHIKDRIPVSDHSIRIKDSTLAGDFSCNMFYSF